MDKPEALPDEPDIYRLGDAADPMTGTTLGDFDDALSGEVLADALSDGAC